ncbi:MAG: PfkB family carbohydrate kinase [Eubacteriales bacterium]|nr:PfkB family carbohydrate kinase [Eubacteriales bacterium]
MPEIITLTLNPCIDRTIPEGREADYTEQTGGKGVNVARVLTRLGVQCAAVVPLGRGENSARFRALAAQEGVPLVESPVGFDVRRIDTYRAADDSQRVVYAKGTDANVQEVEALRQALRSSLAGEKLLIVSGSAPGPMLGAFAGEAIRMAKEMGLETLLDSNGIALEAGFRAGPAMIKPNQKELAQLVGREIPEFEEDRAAEELLAQNFENGLRSVVVSLGARGALWAKEGETLFCPAPKVREVNAVGSGDSFVAGLCRALLCGHSDMGALAMACAAGAANAAVFPAAMIGPEQIQQAGAGASVAQTPGLREFLMISSMMGR